MNCAIRVSFALVFAAGFVAAAAFAVAAPEDAIVGRWDLTVGTAPNTYASWLEVTQKDGRLAGRFVGKGGSARPVKQIEYANGQLDFSLPPQ